MGDTRLVELGRLITGRDVSLFEADYQAKAQQLKQAFGGKRILVVGAAGSIGSSTLKCLLEWQPAEVLLVDTAENNLVEVLREIRSNPCVAQSNVAIEPIDFGSPMMERLLREHQGFDWVFNFAAVKHVRSERDVPSLLQMVDTNLLKADRFLGWVRHFGHGRDGVFFVSSDKAANPANLMGASKRIMEQLLFWHGSDASIGRTLLGLPCSGPPLRATTARFANVAFSDGSLLLGFLNRLSKNQPLAGPSNIRRYFVTLEESGQICCLAAILPAHGQILVPRLDCETDLKDFKAIAALILQFHGLKPRWVTTEEEARLADPHEGWPCFFSESEAMGEKTYEEFVGHGEQTLEQGLQALHLVIPAALPATEVLQVVFAQLAQWYGDPNCKLRKSEIIACLAKVVETLDHVAGEHSLDQRM